MRCGVSSVFRIIWAFCPDLGVDDFDVTLELRQGSGLSISTRAALVMVPSVLRREKCSLGILVRSEQL